MGDQVLNVVLGVVASAVSAALGWLAQTLRRRRRLERTRAFFGLPAGTECLLVVNRHMGSPNRNSVARNDVYALMEVSALVKECGAQAELVAHDQVHQGLGGKAEFCIGGPTSNARSAAHLAWRLPGVRFGRVPEQTGLLTLWVGDREYTYDPGEDGNGAAYALLARIGAGSSSRPVFLVSGLTAITNHAAVRYLAAQHRELARRFGLDGTFALVLRVVNPKAYGPDVVELVGDVTAEAAAPVPAPDPVADPAAPA